MEMTPLPPLKLQASRIGLGTWAIGGSMWGGSEEVESVKTIIAALHAGINLIDTAPVYGFGLAEDIVGRAIKEYGHRDEIIIATKAGLAWQDNKVYRNASRKHIHHDLEASLKRLRTDYIDIYQIHWPDPSTPIEETAETMLSLLQQGKIRAIGVSNFSAAQMEAFMRVAPIHTSQPPYNLFERDIERNLLPYTEEHNIVTLAYGALCRGLLSGRMRLDTVFLGDDIRKIDPKFRAPYFEEYLNAVEALDKFAQHEYGKSVLALAVRWILDRGRTIALWGARHPKQLAEINDALEWNIDKEGMQKIDNILADYVKNPIGPEFMAPGVRENVSMQS